MLLAVHNGGGLTAFGLPGNHMEDATSSSMKTSFVAVLRQNLI